MDELKGHHMDIAAKISEIADSREIKSSEHHTVQSSSRNYPLRILMVVDGSFPGIGGAEYQVEVLAKALHRCGHEVTIVAPLLDPGASRNEFFNNIPLERIPYPRIRIIGALVLAVKFTWRLLKIRKHFDVIHVHIVKNLATVVGMLRPVLRATLIAKVSGAWEFEGGVLDPALESRFTHRFMNYFLKGYDCFQTISTYTKLRLEAAGYSSNKIQMIPNALDMSRFPNERQNKEPKQSIVNVVFGGRLVPVKGLDILIKAWAKVVHRCSDSCPRLLLVGDGPIKGQLIQLVKDHQLDKYVTFLDWIPEISPVLNQADIYVQPSLQEGLPNSVLEAMAASLPIVATKVSGNEDLVTQSENGILVDPGCVDGLAEALCILISNPAMRETMGKYSRQIIETTYQLPKVLEKLLMAYTGKP